MMAAGPDPLGRLSLGLSDPSPLRAAACLEFV